MRNAVACPLGQAIVTLYQSDKYGSVAFACHANAWHATCSHPNRPIGTLSPPWTPAHRTYTGDREPVLTAERVGLTTRGWTGRPPGRWARGPPRARQACARVGPRALPRRRLKAGRRGAVAAEGGRPAKEIGGEYAAAWRHPCRSEEAASLPPVGPAALRLAASPAAAGSGRPGRRSAASSACSPSAPLASAAARGLRFAPAAGRPSPEAVRAPPLAGPAEAHCPCVPPQTSMRRRCGVPAWFPGGPCTPGPVASSSPQRVKRVAASSNPSSRTANRSSWDRGLTERSSREKCRRRELLLAGVAREQAC